MLAEDRTALVVIRIWCEEGSDHPFRGEIRIADDVTYGYRSTQTFACADPLIAAARDVLEEVCRPPTRVTAASHRGHD